MNHVVLIGRLTRDPEVRYTQSGTAVATLRLAVNRRFARRDAENGQPEADFFTIVCWQKLAETVGNNLVKGRQIAVEGRLQTRTYDGQDGAKHYVTEIVANEVEFLGSRTDAQGGGSYGGNNFAPRQNAPAPQAAAPAQPQGFGPDIPDEEIPF